MENELHRRICLKIQENGGRAYLVGGCVRDHLLGIPSLDVDCEVHGMEQSALYALLSSFGEVDISGERFGVYTLRDNGFDFALPRVERLTGSAHTDFEVTPIPTLSPKEAAARRDFTVNAIMMDALTGEIIDPYGGAQDLENGILRAVPGGKFFEDPLRVLRGAQFAARFSLTPDADTLAMMRRMPLHDLSAQRVLSETKKALLGAQRPGIYLHVLRDAAALTPWFKELSEGDALGSAVRMLNRAAALRSRAKEPLALMLAAMTCALSTEDVDNLLARLCVGRHTAALSKSLIEGCAAMRQEDSPPMLVFDRCACAQDLALLCIAGGMDEKEIMARLSAYEAAVSRPMPTGKMLLDSGAQPGPGMRALLAAAREKALMGMDAQEAVKAVLRQEKTFPYGEGGREADG